MGIFGAGNAGAAITLALAPVLIDHWGWASLGPSYAVRTVSRGLMFAWLAPSIKSTAKTSSKL